jgi:uncharacterized repeat protein (TIGR01451 family)
MGPRMLRMRCRSSKTFDVLDRGEDVRAIERVSRGMIGSAAVFALLLLTSTSANAQADIEVNKTLRRGASGPFVEGPITVAVGDVINYQLLVTNAGDTALAVQLSDPVCDAGTLTGPTGDTNGNGQLDISETWTYGCAHQVQAADADPLQNTVMVTGTDGLGGQDTDSDTASADVASTPTPTATPSPSSTPTPTATSSPTATSTSGGQDVVPEIPTLSALPLALLAVGLAALGILLARRS